MSCHVQFAVIDHALQIESGYIHWQGRGRGQLQSVHWKDHQLQSAVELETMESRSQLSVSDVNQRENWISKEDRTPLPSRAPITTSGGSEMPDRTIILIECRNSDFSYRIILLKTKICSFNAETLVSINSTDYKQM